MLWYKCIFIFDNLRGRCDGTDSSATSNPCSKTTSNQGLMRTFYCLAASKFAINPSMRDCWLSKGLSEMKGDRSLRFHRHSCLFVRCRFNYLVLVLSLKNEVVMWFYFWHWPSYSLKIQQSLFGFGYYCCCCCYWVISRPTYRKSDGLVDNMWSHFIYIHTRTTHTHETHYRLHDE